MGVRLTTAFIFDFDGTLVDSKQSIYQCFQNITKQLAPERIDIAKNILIGPPLRDTASEILGPKNQESLENFIKLFIEMHDDQVIRHTKPYQDVTKTLQALFEKKIPMAIATNKRIAPTKKIIEHFGWDSFFSFIECSDNRNVVRNKSEIVDYIIKNDISFRGSCFVGDTVNDGLSANRNNLLFIQACYGYGKNQDWTEVNIKRRIHNISEILVNL